MSIESMKRIIISLLILAGAVAAAFGKQPQKPATITVMSYNVRYGEAKDGTNSWYYRMEANDEMFKDQKPDVVGLQEALPYQMNFFKEFLEGYKGVGVGRDNGKKEGEHMGVFYNTKTVKLLKWGTFWLSETPEKPSMGWDAACYRTATWAKLKDKKTGKTFFFVNTHLDHVGVVAQEEGLKLIVSRIASVNPENLPVIVCGDFNVVPSNPILKPLDAVMKSARKEAMKTDTDATYNAWGHKENEAVIDHIYFEGFSSCPLFEVVRKSYAGRKFISDHYPVKATLIF